MSSDPELDRAEEILADAPSAGDVADTDPLGEQVLNAIRECYDPEIPVNIFDLGLIYRVDIEDDGHVRIDMTLTSPACPVAEILPDEVKTRVEQVEGVSSASIEVVWDPPWHPGMMSEEAQLELGVLY